MVNKLGRPPRPEYIIEAARQKHIQQVIDYLSQKKYPMSASVIASSVGISGRLFSGLVKESESIHPVPIPHYNKTSAVRLYTDTQVKSDDLHNLYSEINNKVVQKFNELKADQISESAVLIEHKGFEIEYGDLFYKRNLIEKIERFLQSNESSTLKKLINEYAEIFKYASYTLKPYTLFDKLLKQVDLDLEPKK